MKLAFGVLDLENFKSALLRPLDADVATPASHTRVWRTLRLSAETRVLHMKLAFEVLDLGNFKSAFLSSLDANMTSPTSQMRVWRTPHLEVTPGSF